MGWKEGMVVRDSRRKNGSVGRRGWDREGMVVCGRERENFRTYFTSLIKLLFSISLRAFLSLYLEENSY